MGRRLRKLAIGLLGAGLTASGAAVGMNLWVLHRGSPYVYARLDDVPPRTVAIVPGAKVYPSGRPTPSLEDRLEAAARLYEAGKVGKVLVSGDHGAPEYDEVNAMGRWMHDRGIPDEDVFLDHAGFRTLDTMARAARVFGVRDAVICTQAYHLPRSIFLAQREDIDAVGFEADRRAYPNAARDATREFAARSVAFVDTYLLGRGPRLLGPTVPIEGDGRRTLDRAGQLESEPTSPDRPHG